MPLPRGTYKNRYASIGYANLSQMQAIHTLAGPANPPQSTTFNCTYDSRGNLVGDEQFTYTWDIFGRITAIEDNASEDDSDIPEVQYKRRKCVAPPGL